MLHDYGLLIFCSVHVSVAYAQFLILCVPYQLTSLYCRPVALLQFVIHSKCKVMVVLVSGTQILYSIYQLIRQTDVAQVLQWRMLPTVNLSVLQIGMYYAEIMFLSGWWLWCTEQLNCISSVHSNKNIFNNRV